MKKIKEFLVDLAFPFLVMVSLGVVFTALIHFLAIQLFDYNIFLETDKEKRLDGFTKIIMVAISITGFISIVLTIIQSRKNIQREIQKNTIDLFKEFRSDAIRDARNRAWDVRDKWRKKPDYIDRYIRYNFKNPDSLHDEELFNDSRAVNTLLEFYSVVSMYEGNQEVLKAIQYFYYGWWRAFLYGIVAQLELNRHINPVVFSKSPSYAESINYTKMLLRLDKMSGLDQIPKEEELHYDGG